MKRIAKSLYKTFGLESESGVTAIEYGLIAAVIAVGIITAVGLVGTNLQSTFNDIATQLGGAAP